MTRRPEDQIPDVRDGLTRVERIVLWQLHETQKEFPNRPVPTATLYGRVVEHIDLSVGELQRILQRLTGRG
jgi:DNA gyrase/topoisomerase IV subunit A